MSLEASSTDLLGVCVDAPLGEHIAFPSHAQIYTRRILDLFSKIFTPRLSRVLVDLCMGLQMQSQLGSCYRFLFELDLLASACGRAGWTGGCQGLTWVILWADWR